MTRIAKEADLLDALADNARFANAEHPSPLVQAFSTSAVADAVHQADARFAATLRAPSLSAKALEDVLEWVDAHGFTELVHAYVPSGNNHQIIALMQERLAARGVRLSAFVRDYDRLVWPHAQKGFFQLGKRIPELLAAMDLEPRVSEEHNP